MQQVEHHMARRGPRPSSIRPDGWNAASPLPQFDLPSFEVADPDRTLKRPQLSAAAVRRVLPSPTPPPVSAEFDGAITVEIVPEIASDDIIEEAPVSVAIPLVTPLVSRMSPPMDLGGLLAKAQSEARRSPEYFHAEPFRSTTPVAPPVAINIVRAESLLADEDEDGFRSMTFPFPGARRHLGWIAATVVTVALATFGIAVAQPHGSSSASSTHAASAARSPVVSRDVAPQPVATHATTSAAVESAIPTVSVQSLPQVEVGTVSLAASVSNHRLFIDGHVASGGSSVVSCGSHYVKVGSRGVSHRIVVPCGEEVIVER